jgi:hypothetical protein
MNATARKKIVRLHPAQPQGIHSITDVLADFLDDLPDCESVLFTPWMADLGLVCPYRGRYKVEMDDGVHYLCGKHIRPEIRLKK